MFHLLYTIICQYYDICIWLALLMRSTIVYHLHISQVTRFCEWSAELAISPWGSKFGLEFRQALGDQPFFHGEKPGPVDLSLYGLLVLLWLINQLQQDGLKHSHLMGTSCSLLHIMEEKSNWSYPAFQVVEELMQLSKSAVQLPDFCKQASLRLGQVAGLVLENCPPSNLDNPSFPGLSTLWSSSSSSSSSSSPSPSPFSNRIIIIPVFHPFSVLDLDVFPPDVIILLDPLGFKAGVARANGGPRRCRCGVPELLAL